MGETQNQSFQLSFNPCLKVDFQGSRVTSDGGLLLVRELDERLGLSALIAENIRDERRGKNTQLPLPDLLRQSIYSRLAGYEDVNDAERLSQDPTFRLIGSAKIMQARGQRRPALPIDLGRGGRGRVLQKHGEKGAILVMSVRIARASGALGGNNVSQCQQSAKEAYNAAVFEFKKEIPVKLS